MTSRTWRVAATLLIGAIHAAKAQVSPARPDTTVVRDAGVAAHPRRVQLEVVVGADGQPERPNIRVVSSTHDLFTIAARNAVRQ